jgi:hypothetical protein
VPPQDIAIDALLVESVAPFQWALNYHLPLLFVEEQVEPLLFVEEQVEPLLPVAPASKRATSASGGGGEGTAEDAGAGGWEGGGREGGGLLAGWRRQKRRGRSELAQGQMHPIESTVAETDVLDSEDELCNDNGCSSTSHPNR